MFYTSLQKLFFCYQENQSLELQIFKSHGVIKCIIIENVLLNNLGSQHSLLMKFGQYISYNTRKKFIEKFYKNCDPKTTISDKNYGKNCYLSNFVFLPPSPS